MKIFHLSDLHIGKRIKGVSMLGDQRDVLRQVVDLVKDHHPKAVILAGDIYDKSVPSAEAVELFDDFLSQLSATGTIPLVIYGNHDSAERLAFANRLLEQAGCYVSPVYDGSIRTVTLQEDGERVVVHLLPFVKPVDVRNAMSNEEQQSVAIGSYTDALRWAVGRQNLDPECFNILVAHQFVSGAKQCDSEDSIVGGLENVDSSVFDAFNYVALGHLHCPQFVDRQTVRYSGSPLKYSFSEVNDEKSVTMLDIEDGEVNISLLDLKPLHEWFDLRGKFADLQTNQLPQQDGFVRITLTDDEDVYDAFARLRQQYPNLLEMSYDNARTRAANATIETSDTVLQQSPLEIFDELYALQNDKQHMDDQQKEYIQSIINQIWNN